jgi:RHS repeat-associated protein
MRAFLSLADCATRARVQADHAIISIRQVIDRIPRFRVRLPALYAGRVSSAPLVEAKSGALFTIILVGALLIASSDAWSQALAPAFPVYRAVDANGVDVNSGTLGYRSKPIAVGGQTGSIEQSYLGRGYRDSLTGTMTADFISLYVSIGGNTVRFYTNLAGGPTTLSTPDKLEYISSNGTYKFTSENGDIAIFDTNLKDMPTVDSGVALIKSLRKPSGETYTYYYNSSKQMSAVVSSAGYMVKYTYSGGALQTVTALNLAYDACDPTANACTYSRPWPSRNYTGLPAFWASGTFTETDALGNATTITQQLVGSSTPRITRIIRPSGLITDITYDATEGFGDRVVKVTAGGNEWNYAYNTIPWNGQDSYTYSMVTVVDPSGKQSVFDRDPNCSRITSYFNPLYSESYRLDAACRYDKVTYTDGRYIQYYYDSIGRIDHINNVSSVGAIRTQQFAYNPNCPSTSIACNKPTSVTNFRSATTEYAYTDYTYDDTHGGVLTVTQPAPTSGAVRPEVRTTYQAFNAWYKNASGAIGAGTTIYLPTTTSSCATLSSCAGTVDEIKKTISYQSGSASVASNLLPISTTSSDGASVVSATTTMSYNARGDAILIDGPAPGSADTTRRFFDALRQPTGEIGPDPDGTGALLYSATRSTYDGAGNLTLLERGTAANQTDTGLATGSFTPLTQTRTGFDAFGRKTWTALETPNGTVQTFNQFGYDAAGRPICSTVRMNPALFSPTVGPCSLGSEGASSKDRILYTTYDAAGRPWKVTSGYGLSAAMDLRTITYTAGNKVWTEADGAGGSGNKTTYEYDEFNRLKKTIYPVASSVGGGSSNSGDYEEYGYDANDNRTYHRRRDNQAITTIYDVLNRPTSKDLPATTYSYDNLGRLKTVAQGGRTITSAYDALDRLKSEAGPIGTVSYEYDSDRRIRMTWPDGVYLAYDYFDDGALKAIKRNGGSSGADLVAQFSYDDLGRRSGLTRGNAVNTAYEYDTALRFKALRQDASGAADDVRFDLIYNPAGQVLQRTISSSAYVWEGRFSSDRSYAPNGLNQIATAAGVSLQYDARGNLVEDRPNPPVSPKAYSYDVDNRLTATGSGAALAYDPVGRLYQTTTVGGTVTRYLYDGADLIGEYSGSNGLLRRYAHGFGIDEVLARYDAAGVPTWMLSDQQGSIIALSNSAGVVTAKNTYDDYGLPGASNQGLFQYTGQVWLSDLSLYHYKARAYSPSLGRFLQTDPAKYDAGDMNLYAYVGNDPLNMTDPTGMIPCGARGETPCEPALPPPPPFPAEAPAEVAPVVVVGPSPSNLGGYLYPIDPLGSFELAAEHKKNARPSTQQKHQDAEARRDRDRGGEKGDKNRPPPRKKPKGHKGPWPVLPKLRMGPVLMIPTPNMQQMDQYICAVNPNAEVCNDEEIIL